MMIVSCFWYMHAVLFIIRFILANDNTNAAFQFLSGEAFLKSSSILSQIPLFH